MIELLVGLVLGELLGARWGWPRDAVWILDGLLGAGLYTLSCLWWSHRRCWWPWCSARNPTSDDGRGNLHIRWSCPICAGKGRVRRLGARLLGRG